jgi:hypothetical protein
MNARDRLSTDDLAERPADSTAQEEPDSPAEAEPDDAFDAHAETDTPLLPSDASSEFEERWRQIQTNFVDEPRAAVEEADSLVAELMQRLATSFSETRSQLESQWDQGDDVSTEDLRVALTRYRSFFRRLLAA